MTRLAEACASRPFSNGTERDAWESAWCYYCVRDHGITHDPDGGTGCELLLLIDLDEFPASWPEAWLPEPDDGQFYLPSRMTCAAFEPCTLGACTGDPGAEGRAERVAEVTAYWQANR